MNLELINQLYLKLKLEYKTKKEIYERIKRELSLDVKTESIKKAHERYLKKKEAGQDKTGQKKDIEKKTIGQDKKTKVQTEIILNGGKKTDKEIMEQTGTAKTTFYRYKKQVRQPLIERSQKMLIEALEFAYPDEDEILKRVMGKKRNILINSMKILEENSTDKDTQIALQRAISNIRTIAREIQTDLQVVSIYTQAEYEKQLVEESIEIEKFELDKEQIKNGDAEEKTGIKAVIDEIIGVANERNKENK